MIYLINCKDNNTCKIGYSIDPKKRLLQLQTSNSSKLELLETIIGTFETEKLIHEKFKKDRLKGEWFNFTNDIKKFFKINEEPPFVKLYYSNVKDLYKLTNLELKVLLELSKLIKPYITESDNLIIVNSSTKDSIAEAVGLTGFHKTGVPKKYDVSKYINKLVKKSFLIYVKTQHYILNPVYLKKENNG